MADLIQGIDIPTTGGTDHTPAMAPSMGDISAGHIPGPCPTTTEAAVLEGTPCTPLPATAAACATPQLMDASITPCAVIPTGIVVPHPTLATSPAGATHATLHTRASLSSAHPTKQHKDLSPAKSNNASDPQHPINSTAPRL